MSCEMLLVMMMMMMMMMMVIALTRSVVYVHVGSFYFQVFCQITSVRDLAAVCTHK